MATAPLINQLLIFNFVNIYLCQNSYKKLLPLCYLGLWIVKWSLRKDIHGSTKEGKRQDFLSILGAWGTRERVEGDNGGREGSRVKCIAQ